MEDSFDKASKVACQLLREHFIGIDHLNIVAVGDGIGPYDDEYIIRNYELEWSMFMDGWRYGREENM